MQLSNYEEEAISAFCQSVYQDKWSEEGLVSLWKLIGEDFLALMRVSEYADEHEVTPQGVRKFRKDRMVEMCGYQLMINRENT